MFPAARLRRLSADRPSMGRICRAACGVAFLAGLTATPSWARADTRYSAECQVVDTTRLESFGHNGHAAQLSHFTCRITGGPMDGALVTGTNIWDLSDERSSVLLGSLAVAQRAGMNVMYEVYGGTRTLQTRDGKPAGWEASSWGIYRSATGSAAHLTGKTFTSVVRYSGPRSFTVENIISED